MPPITFRKPENANLTLDPVVNAALGHIADELHVSKSAYVEALLRVKFHLAEDEIALKDAKKEDIFQHLLKETTPPPELSTFEYKGTPSKRPGQRKYHVTANHSAVALGDHATAQLHITRVRAAARKPNKK
jgi:hypothetical protein